MLEMFKGVANSPETTITNNISNLDTIIYVLDETRIPPELPNLMVLGTGTGAETVKVVSIDGNAITVERGFQGVAKAWNAGTIIARNFTEYDYNALVENVNEVNTNMGPIASLLSRIKTSIVNAINGLQEDVDAHKAEMASKHIKESGSNENGSYIKFDDGTMICRMSNILIGGNDAAYVDVSVTFPATFAATPTLSTVAKKRDPAGTTKPFTAMCPIVSSTGISVLRVMYCDSSPLESSCTFTVDVLAVGMWK